MSSVQLLDKTRKIGKLLHNSNSGKVVFNDICRVLCDILASNMFVISKKGKVLGIGESENVESLSDLLVDNVGSFIDPMLNERLLTILSTKADELRNSSPVTHKDKTYYITGDYSTCLKRMIIKQIINELGLNAAVEVV